MTKIFYPILFILLTIGCSPKTESEIMDDSYPKYMVSHYSGGVMVGKWGVDSYQYNVNSINFTDKYSGKNYTLFGEITVNETTDTDKEIYAMWLKQIESRRVKVQLEQNIKRPI